MRRGVGTGVLLGAEGQAEMCGDADDGQTIAHRVVGRSLAPGLQVGVDRVECDRVKCDRTCSEVTNMEDAAYQQGGDAIGRFILMQGLPAPDLCSHPVGKTLLDASPAFKEALARGFVVGVITKPALIQIHRNAPENLFGAIKAELRLLCDVELAG